MVGLMFVGGGGVGIEGVELRFFRVGCGGG